MLRLERCGSLRFSRSRLAFVRVDAATPASSNDSNTYKKRESGVTVG
jgi:hypothetical protein